MDNTEDVTFFVQEEGVTVHQDINFCQEFVIPITVEDIMNVWEERLLCNNNFVQFMELGNQTSSIIKLEHTEGRYALLTL